MTNSNYGKMTTQELIAAMRGKPAQSLDYTELDAELQRRVAMSGLAAGTAQIHTAWYQLAATIAMFLTAIATAAVPWLSK